ncbi:hypothetical protein JZ751_021806 [Albula glossodonta]|uniref:Uncharacterized protein n=1 Tax=Albula glossodonta TaxID=121402 RepID=A0A8T2MS22_9TELE|nr:hypothetical protein JZ751_021806 [Albula glossodonta]
MIDSFSAALFCKIRPPTSGNSPSLIGFVWRYDSLKTLLSVAVSGRLTARADLTACSWKKTLAPSSGQTVRNSSRVIPRINPPFSTPNKPLYSSQAFTSSGRDILLSIGGPRRSCWGKRGMAQRHPQMVLLMGDLLAEQLQGSLCQQWHNPAQSQGLQLTLHIEGRRGREEERRRKGVIARGTEREGAGERVGEKEGEGQKRGMREGEREEERHMVSAVIDIKYASWYLPPPFPVSGISPTLPRQWYLPPPFPVSGISQDSLWLEWASVVGLRVIDPACDSWGSMRQLYLPEGKAALAQPALQEALESLRLKERECVELRAELEAMELECHSCQSRLKQCREELRQLSTRRAERRWSSWLGVAMLLLLGVAALLAVCVLHPPLNGSLQLWFRALLQGLQLYLRLMASPQYSGCFRPI